MGTHLLSVSYQKIYILVFLRNFKIITFKDQEIYKCKESFNRAMHDLHAKGLVEMRRSGGNLNEYKITEKGAKIGDALSELTT